MRVLIIGGMHGNEPLGLNVIKLFQQKPHKTVDVIVANKLAMKANTRFIGQDLNRSFPGNSVSEEYEPRRAAQLLDIANGYDLVLDFHNTYCPNNDCGFLGQSANGLLYGVAVMLGLNSIIVADYDCINKYASNCLSVEVSLDSELNEAEIWYERIAQLSKLSNVSEDVSGLQKYHFIYRMTLEDRDKYDLQSKELKAFEAISSELADKLGVASPAYPIFIADKFTPYNYGGLLNKL